MLFKSFVITVLAGAACADWVIENSKTFTAKDSQQLQSMTKAYDSQVSSYLATLRTGPEWTKAVDVLRAYQQTGKDVPAIVTATAVTTYTTTPAWYAAMPTQAKNVFDGVEKKAEDIAKAIQSDVNKKNSAARPNGMGIYISGAMAVMVAGVAVAL